MSIYAMEATKFNSSLKSVKTRGANLQADVHVLLMAALAQALPVALGGGTNTDYMARVVAALPDAISKNTVSKWVAHHSNISLKFDGKTNTYTAKLLPADQRKGDNALAILIEAANNKPFYVWQAANDKTALTIDDASFDRDLARLMAKYTDPDNKVSLSDKSAAIMTNVIELGTQAKQRIEVRAAQKKQAA